MGKEVPASGTSEGGGGGFILDIVKCIMKYI